MWVGDYVTVNFFQFQADYILSIRKHQFQADYNTKKNDRKISETPLGSFLDFFFVFFE